MWQLPWVRLWSDCVAAPLGQIVYTDPRKLRSPRRVFLMIEVRHSCLRVLIKEIFQESLIVPPFYFFAPSDPCKLQTRCASGQSFIISKLAATYILISFPPEVLCLSFSFFVKSLPISISVQKNILQFRESKILRSATVSEFRFFPKIVAMCFNQDS